MNRIVRHNLISKRVVKTEPMGRGRTAAHHCDEASATPDLLAAQAVDLGDFFAFAVERTSALDRIRDGAAVR